MKINKIVGLGLAIVLGLGLVGCGDTEVEEQEQTVQQQEVQDEEEYQVVDPQEVERHENDEDKNLNKEARNGEYQFEEREVEQQYSIDIVCNALDEVLGEELTQIGVDYELYVYSEETGTIALIITLPKSELMATDVNTWNQLVQGATQNWSTLASDYGYSFIVGIQDEEGTGYMVAKDGVLYVDVFNGINKLN